MKRKLDVTTIRKATIPEGKNRRKLSDGGGLFLLLKLNKDSSITRSWRYTYRFPKGSTKQDECQIGEGQFPQVTLAEARKLHEEAIAMVDKGINPRLARKAVKKARIDSAATTFELVAREWWNAGQWEKKHKAAKLSQFERFVFPHIGHLPIAEVQISDIMDVLKAIVSTGVTDTHMRVNSNIRLVFDYYRASRGKTMVNPAASITPKMVKDAMPGMKPHIKRHFASLKDPAEIGALLKAIDKHEGITMQALLKFSVLVSQRPSETRFITWDNVDFDHMLWRIPARDRKLNTHLKEMDREEDEHFVPLSRQARQILENLKPFTGTSAYVFQSPTKPNAPYSETRLNKTLEKLGFKGKQTGHGFRHMASTTLNGMQRWSEDVIEAHLSHKIKGVRGDYLDPIGFLAARREMVQVWADYLDSLRNDALTIQSKYT